MLAIARRSASDIAANPRRLVPLFFFEALRDLKLRRVGVCRRAREVLLCVRAIFEPSI